METEHAVVWHMINPGTQQFKYDGQLTCDVDQCVQHTLWFSLSEVALDFWLVSGNCEKDLQWCPVIRQYQISRWSFLLFRAMAVLTDRTA